MHTTCRWGWRYDEAFQASSYTFTNLDLLSMTNIANRDPRLWVHLASAWVITWVVWRVLPPRSQTLRHHPEACMEHLAPAWLIT